VPRRRKPCQGLDTGLRFLKYHRAGAENNSHVEVELVAVISDNFCVVSRKCARSFCVCVLACQRASAVFLRSDLVDFLVFIVVDFVHMARLASSEIAQSSFALSSKK
jgi:hypothetical protein